MANSKRRCTYCKEYYPVAIGGVKLPGGFFCNYDHAIKYARAKQLKASKLKVKAEAKAERAHTRQRKKELMTRSQWYDRRQRLVNPYVTRIQDFGKPC